MYLCLKPISTTHPSWLWLDDLFGVRQQQEEQEEVKEMKAKDADEQVRPSEWRDRKRPNSHSMPTTSPMLKSNSRRPKQRLRMTDHGNLSVVGGEHGGGGGGDWWRESKVRVWGEQKVQSMGVPSEPPPVPMLLDPIDFHLNCSFLTSLLMACLWVKSLKKRWNGDKYALWWWCHLIQWSINLSELLMSKFYFSFNHPDERQKVMRARWCFLKQVKWSRSGHESNGANIGWLVSLPVLLVLLVVVAAVLLVRMASKVSSPSPHLLRPQTSSPFTGNGQWNCSPFALMNWTLPTTTTTLPLYPCINS